MGGISLGIAFLAGILLFLSPCIFPLVPFYLSFLAGRATKTASRSSLIFPALLFVLGFSLVFIAMGALVGFLGFYLRQDFAWLIKAAGIFLIVFGLHVIGILKIPWLYQERRFQLAGNKLGPFMPFVVGLSFGLGWSPCIGPILGGILTLAYASETALQGTMLLTIFSLGLALPFLFSALFIERISGIIKRMGRAFKAVEVISGLALIIIGILILTDRLVQLNDWFNFLEFTQKL